MKKEVLITVFVALLVGLSAMFLVVYASNNDEPNAPNSGTVEEHTDTDDHGHDADGIIADSHTDGHDAELDTAPGLLGAEDHAVAANDDHADDEDEHGTTAAVASTDDHGHDAAPVIADSHTDGHDAELETAPGLQGAEDHAVAADDDHADDEDEHGTAAAVASTDDHGHDATVSTVETSSAEHGHDDDAANESHAEEEAGHGHGTPQLGYMGLEEKTAIDQDELNAFVTRVEEEAYEKGRLDQVRFGLFGLFFAVTYLAFAKIKRGNISQRLKNAIDWNTLGTITGIILIFLVIPSGIVITFFYMPTSTEVYSSVEDMTNQPVLAFFRNLHNWSSEIFILLSLLHAARTVSTRTFLGKRKLIWLLGALALVVGWVAFLTGTFMRGDQEALEGFEHMMYSFTLVPLGQLIVDFFSGEYTLMKLTALHIGVTMFIIALTLVLHVLMRKVHVLVTTRWKKAVAYSLALTVFLVVQSVAMEAPFVRGPESGPTVSGIEATKPPWPIYFLIQGENWFGADAMVAILLVAFVPLIIFPYVIEFLPFKAARKARLGEALFYLGVFAMIGVSYIAAAGEIKAHIF